MLKSLSVAVVSIFVLVCDMTFLLLDSSQYSKMKNKMETGKIYCACNKLVSSNWLKKNRVQSQYGCKLLCTVKISKVRVR